MLTQKPKSLVSVLTFVCLSLLTSMLIMEGVFLFLLNHPKIANLNPVVFGYTRYLYEGFDKQHIQISSCAQYHPDLFYTLKPGDCEFNEREFKSHYHINSMGLRDDEESLKAPEIIAVGDSFTMGWGVDQNETFASILEQKTGLKTLNAGIASYGTVREMILLSKLDLSHLKYLILQYCPNDCSENFELRGNGKLSISSREDYESDREMHRKTHRYYPGRYSIEALKIWAETNPLAWLNQKLHPSEDSQIMGEPYTPKPNDGGPEDCARLVIQTLDRFIKKLPALEKVHIIFLNLKLDHTLTPLFTDWVSEAAKDPSNPPVLKNLKVVHSSEFLRKWLHYYTLDDHMNAKGHQAIAEALLNVMNQN